MTNGWTFGSHGVYQLVQLVHEGRPAGSAGSAGSRRTTRAQTTAPKPKKVTDAPFSAAPPDCPKPNRIVPHILNSRDQIVPNTFLDVDWTRHPDWEVEKIRRTERDNMCISELREGRRVVFRSSGISLEPRVWNNDICTFFPVTSEKEVQVDDIVFCSVQPNDHIYGHIVKKKWWQFNPSSRSENGQEYVYVISNINGRENGWCNTRHIYGKLVDDRSKTDLD